MIPYIKDFKSEENVIYFDSINDYFNSEENEINDNNLNHN